MQVEDGRIHTPPPPPPPPPSSGNSGCTASRPSHRTISAFSRALIGSACFLRAHGEPTGKTARQLALDLGVVAQEMQELAAPGELAGHGHALARQFVVQPVEPLQAVL